MSRLKKVYDLSVTILSIDGIATAVMPVNRQPIYHDMLMDRWTPGQEIQEAILGSDFLRITVVTSSPVEVHPDDTFAYGWELMNIESGWRSTDIWHWAVREICSNGILGLNEIPVFRRASNSFEPNLLSLNEMFSILRSDIQPFSFEEGIKWASENSIGDELSSVVEYLMQRLQGKATKIELQDIAANTTWYDLMNLITALAGLYPVHMRRRYERQGGSLLRWFIQQGKTRPPWRKAICSECEVRNTNMSYLRE